MLSAPNAASTHMQLALKAESEAVQQFVDLLELEQSALTLGETDALPDYAEKKITLAVHLSRLAAERNDVLTKQGFGTDKSGIEDWLAKHPIENNSHQVWLNILASASKARDLNRLNGELIALRMQYNEKALEALRGGNRCLDLYGPDGQSTSAGSRRIIDSV